MRTHFARLTAFIAVCALTLGACSSGSTAAKNVEQTSRSDATKRDPDQSARPAGPAGRVSGPLTGGEGINLATASTGPAIPKTGWIEAEFAVDGTATSYQSDGELPADGSFDLVVNGEADYRTRIVVRRPKQAKNFNGTVVVEWLNVSGGLDANPDFAYTRTELLRGGYAWVGVSAQSIGIEGGPVAVRVPAAEAAGAGKGLRAIDPARYGDLHHPGDAFSYDIYTQVARTLRAPNGVDALGELTLRKILAVGESQSAFALTTYVNGVQPLTREFDGFLIHSRGGAAAPLGQAGAGIDIAGTIGGKPTLIRTDGPAPIIVVETESDVLGFLNYYPARQPDDAKFRLWEVAGTAHADRYLIGDLGEGIGCLAPVNAGPAHYVIAAALHDLNRWVGGGAAPPKAPRLEVDASGAFVRDEYGNALGGIRTPLVDAPVDTLSGESAGGSIACVLFGSTTPLTDAQLSERYASGREYVAEFLAAADAAIRSGFVLRADRKELLAEAEPFRLAP